MSNLEESWILLLVVIWDRAEGPHRAPDDQLIKMFIEAFFFLKKITWSWFFPPYHAPYQVVVGRCKLFRPTHPLIKPIWHLANFILYHAFWFILTYYLHFIVLNTCPLTHRKKGKAKNGKSYWFDRVIPEKDFRGCASPHSNGHPLAAGLECWTRSGAGLKV